MQVSTSQANESSRVPLPPELKQRLVEFRSRLWSVKIAEGALAGVVGLILSYLLVFGLDRLFDTPAPVRLALLGAGAAIPGLGLPFLWHRWVWRRQSLEQVARLLKRRFPKLGDELLGIVELARSDSSGSSRVLIEAAMRQVGSHVADKSFEEAVPDRHYGKWLAATLGVVGIALAAFVVVSDAAENALYRWLTPWKPIARFTFARLDPLPRQLIVPYAETFDVNARLREDTEWRPSEASLRLSGDASLRAPREDDSYRFSVPPRQEETSLAIRAGDVRERIAIRPLTRPELTGLTATVRLPDYLRYERDLEVPVSGGSLSALTGSIVTLSASTSRPLAEAELDGEPVSLREKGFVSPPLPIGVSRTHQLRWRDVHDLTAKSPFALRIDATDDAAPRIFAEKLSEETVILPDEIVLFSLRGSDDFGLRRVGLSWRGLTAPEISDGEKMVADGSAESRELAVRGTFSAERENVSPQTLEIRAWAEDFLPGRERTYSSSFVVRVLEPDEHAKWLTDEFAKWFRNAREVYERERQLNETNRTLRTLPLEQLDQPDVRRQIERQANEERANARRLESLSTLGRDLVRQATKNEEFDARRLDSWAEMMGTLEDIAQNRMPSVADLLEEAARQPAASDSAEAGEDEGEEDNPAAGSSGQPEDAESADSPESSSSPPSITNPDAPQPEAAESASNPSPGSSSPSIQDREPGMTPPENAEGGDDASQAGSDSRSAGLSLPSTTLDAAPAQNDDEKESSGSPTSRKVEEAVAEQDELLAEFARVAEDLREILASLEASTFVKRLKSASRTQRTLAEDLDLSLAGTFGAPADTVAQQLREDGKEKARLAEEESERIYHILTDLEAYYQRKKEDIYRNVLDQMKDSGIVTAVKQLGKEIEGSFTGRSITAAELWSDTLDRWAEELVAAAEEGQSGEGEGEGEQSEGLPPEIVLQVMKALRDEMDLREETRELENTRSALASTDYAAAAAPLEEKQADIRQRTDEAISQIQALPEAESKHGRELQLLTLVSDIMRQSRAVLARPDSGPEAIAAQTEVIELLLQARRQPPNGGGGGGGGSSSSDGRSGSGDGNGGLSDIRLRGEAEAAPASSDRDVDQSTGRTGREFPDEFRSGLDTYFDTLEESRSDTP